MPYSCNFTLLSFFKICTVNVAQINTLAFPTPTWSWHLRCLGILAFSKKTIFSTSFHYKLSKNIDSRRTRYEHTYQLPCEQRWMAFKSGVTCLLGQSCTWRLLQFEKLIRNWKKSGTDTLNLAENIEKKKVFEE